MISDRLDRRRVMIAADLVRAAVLTVMGVLAVSGELEIWHMVVLVDQETASDGEAFADGFRRLGLGPVIGARTWGGEIWLSSANTLSDGGVARAPMSGVYGPDGKWLIEQEGVLPDIVVENLPHATFNGTDAQLDAAIAYLQKKLAQDPRPVPKPPAYPKRAFKYPQQR